MRSDYEQLHLPGLEPEPTGFVYLLRRGDQVKIGYSKTPQRRARDLGMPLLGIIPGNRDDERRLHERFASSRIVGEYYFATADIIQFIIDEVAKWLALGPDEAA